MKTIVLTFDDAVRSQLTIVAPVLKRFGFGATFFVCRFSDEWRAQHSEHLMGLEELRELQRQGFEIGNHTWSHPNMRELSDAENAREVDSLSEWLKSGGKWYYFGSDSVMLANTSQEIGGKVYNFNSSGACTNP